MTKRYLEVVEIETGKVVKRLDVSGRSERRIEKLERGLLRQVNRDRYLVKDTALGEEGDAK